MEKKIPPLFTFQIVLPLFVLPRANTYLHIKTPSLVKGQQQKKRWRRGIKAVEKRDSRLPIALRMLRAPCKSTCVAKMNGLRFVKPACAAPIINHMDATEIILEPELCPSA